MLTPSVASLPQARVLRCDTAFGDRMKVTPTLADSRSNFTHDSDCSVPSSALLAAKMCDCITALAQAPS